LFASPLTPVVAVPQDRDESFDNNFALEGGVPSALLMEIHLVIDVGEYIVVQGSPSTGGTRDQFKFDSECRDDESPAFLELLFELRYPIRKLLR
jgi:hypothetical protein